MNPSMKRTLSGCCLLAVFMIFITGSAFGVVIQVPGDYATVQAGIEAATAGDTVFVADGTYTGDGNRDIDFLGKPITVMSENGPETCVIECEGSKTDPHRGFWFQNYENVDSILDGFTIQNGDATGFTESYGGGIFCSNATPLIINCLIRGNTAEEGGGIAIRYGDVQISNSTIVENTATSKGGGIFIEGGLIISNSTISENSVGGSELFCDHWAMGGGIFIVDGFSEIVNCLIEGNMSTGDGGGIHTSYFSSNDIRLFMINSTISQNAAVGSGGGIQISEDDDIQIGGAEETGNFFTGNSAVAGADLYCGEGTSVTHLTAYNTFAGNFESDYYVSPGEAFDLTGCTSGTVLITQDVFVSPSGDDANNGLTWDTAFRTIHHALTSVIGTELSPVTVHLGSGTYSTSLTGERFPLPLMDFVSILGENRALVILDAEGGSNIFQGDHDNQFSISNLTIKGGEYITGGGISLESSSPLIANCNFLENNAPDCGISYGCGGAIYIDRSSATLSNCVFSGNSADSWGGGLYMRRSDPVISGCEFTSNRARLEGGGICVYSWNPVVIGGSLENANTFSGNRAAGSADLALKGSTCAIDASYNIFEGYHPSNYYVSPHEYFDLSNCTSNLIPITQDVFVSVTGDNARDGLTWDTAFQTIQHALSRVYGTEGNPVTIHIGPGRFAPSSTAERFPLPLVSYVNVVGASAQETILDAEGAFSGLYGNHESGMLISGLTITGCDQEIGSSSYCIRLRLGSNQKVSDCIITGNSNSGGMGIYHASGQCQITNTLISNNSGVGINLYYGDPVISNCTIAENRVGLIFAGLASPTIRNSIVWNNIDQQINTGGLAGSLDATHSNIQGGIEGEGNIDSDPLFTDGLLGEYYLGQTSAGQPANSPCLDSGGVPAPSVCFESGTGEVCLNVLTTRTDLGTDSGLVDMGYHYASIVVTPTATPTNGDFIRITDSSGCNGEIINVSIMVSNEFTAIDRIALDIGYEVDVLEFQSGEPGNLDPGWMMFECTETSPGTVTISAFADLVEIPTGSHGVLATLSFRVNCLSCINNDVSQMIFISLGDDLVNFDTENGGFTYYCLASPTPTPEFSPPPSATPTAENIIWISDTAGCDGETIDVDIMMSNGSRAVDVFTFHFGFETDVLEYQGCAPGNLDPGWFMFDCNESAPGEVIVGGFSLETGIPSGSQGVLATLSFLVNCPLCVNNDVSQMIFISLNDGIANFSAENGEFTYSCIASPTPTSTSLPTQTPTPTPTPEIALGVRLDMPIYVRPGDPFWITGELWNDGTPVADARVFFFLEIYGDFLCWPGWTLNIFDATVMDVPRGVTPIEVIPKSAWPDTGAVTVTDLWFFGGILNPEMTEILGEFDSVQWGYGR